MDKTNMMNSSLPQAERDKLEERIIAYFEGSLDGESSSQLLKDVAETAEKRSLFHSYEVLDRVIAAARTPLEAPLEVKRGIVERIPGLLAWIPGLLGTAPAIPVLTGSANPIIGFLSKIPLSTAISVGTSAVVLTTAGVIVKNKLDGNAAQQARERVSNVRTYEAPQTSTPHTYAPLESRDLSSNLGGATATSAIAEEHVAGASHATTYDHSNSNAHVPAAHNVTPVEHETIARDRSNANAPIANKTVASQPIAATPAPKEEPKDETTPLMSVAPLEVSSAKANTNVILNPGSVMRPLPVELTDAMSYRWFAYAGSRVVEMNAVKGNTRSYTTTVFAAGVDIPVATDLSIVAKVGRSAFAHARNEFSAESSSSGLPIYGTQTQTSNDQQVWTTAGLSYRVTKIADYPVFTSLDLGTVFFGNDVGLMGGAGLSTEIPVFGQFALRPTVTYDMVRSSVVDVPNNLRAPRGAIMMDNKTSLSNVWTSAFGFGVTFSTRF